MPELENLQRDIRFQCHMIAKRGSNSPIAGTGHGLDEEDFEEILLRR